MVASYKIQAPAQGPSSDWNYEAVQWCERHPVHLWPDFWEAFMGKSEKFHIRFMDSRLMCLRETPLGPLPPTADTLRDHHSNSHHVRPNGSRM